MISQSHREYIEGFVLQTKELLLLLVLCNLTSDEKAAASLKSLLPLMLCLYSQWEKSAHDIMCSSPGDVCTNTNAWMCLCRDTCGLRSAETDPSCTWTLITTTSSHVSNSRPTGRNAARPLHSGFTKVVGSYPRGITYLMASQCGSLRVKTHTVNFHIVGRIRDSNFLKLFCVAPGSLKHASLSYNKVHAASGGKLTDNYNNITEYKIQRLFPSGVTEGVGVEVGGGLARVNLS